MKLILEDDEIKEVTLDNFIDNKDKAKITIVGENQGKRHEGKSDIVKEIIANDALVIGSTRAAELHGVPIQSAHKYKNGMDITDDATRDRILAKKYDIADEATAKLMATLGLFDPADIEKPLDKVKAAALLATVVEKVSDRGKSEGNAIHLHLYAPKQNSINKYDVIDV